MMNAYTGRLFEQEVAGRCLCASSDYMPFRKAMAIVRQSQPGNPSDPLSPVMNDFHALLCEELSEEDYSVVKFYTAVGSPLDYWHGIDCFIEWRGVTVTIDLTLDEKKDSYKADIILHEGDVYTDDGEVNRPQLQEVARHFAQLLGSRDKPAFMNEKKLAVVR